MFLRNRLPYWCFIGWIASGAAPAAVRGTPQPTSQSRRTPFHQLKSTQQAPPCKESSTLPETLSLDRRTANFRACL
jgi:hypothetical protein